MRFDEVIGHDDAKERLKAMVAEGHLPHALLFCGTPGRTDFEGGSVDDMAVSLKRLIQRQVVDNVANLIIAGEVSEGDTVRVDVGPDDRLVAMRAEGVPVEPDVIE